MTAHCSGASVGRLGVELTEGHQRAGSQQNRRCPFSSEEGARHTAMGAGT